MSMRMPNGYGAIVKLSGQRREPYAVRITTGYRIAGTEDAPRAVQVYRYLEYFEKRADAMKYLANYNSGIRVKEHRSLEDIQTFAEIFQTVMQERRDSRKGMKKSLDSAYTAAFKRLQKIHDTKICNLRYSDIQPVINQNRNMSRATVYNMITVCHMVAAYALKYEKIRPRFVYCAYIACILRF